MSGRMSLSKLADKRKQENMHVQMTVTAPSATYIKGLYARMLLARIVDDYAWKMHIQGSIHFVASCRGHEAAQIGSAVCIEVGKDFTLPYYRDLGVVLTMGMTPYEVFRAYLQKTPCSPLENNASTPNSSPDAPELQHWSYHKHNTVTGPAPIATQILHAAGIAFACKLRQAPIVTVAYCSDSIIAEADFLEGIRFAALHRLPVVFICEQDYTSNGSHALSIPSCTQGIELPDGLTHQRIDGADIATVHTSMQIAMQHARSGLGPTLLEMSITRLSPTEQASQTITEKNGQSNDPLVRCQRHLQEQGVWDQEWASQLYTRFASEVEHAMQDAIRDTL